MLRRRRNFSHRDSNDLNSIMYRHYKPLLHELEHELLPSTAFYQNWPIKYI